MSNVSVHKVFETEVSKKTGNSPTVSEDVYVIPNGQTLRLAAFSGGHEYSTQEVRIELVHRVGGTDTAIAVGFGAAFQYRIDRDFAGNGADSIVMRFINGDSGGLRMAGWWDGTTHE